MSDNAAPISDHDLAEQTRGGNADAYAQLWERHAQVGRVAARQFESIADPDDLVTEAYLRIYRALQNGGGPREAFRPYLYRTIRNIALDWRQRDPEQSLDTIAELESAEPDLEDTVATRTITAHAFRTLPERWQTILWYTEVEGMPLTEAAEYLGISANAAGVLAHRARAGLKKAWLQAHVNDRRVPPDCRWATDRMGASVNGGLTSAEQRRFDAHVASCSRCSILLEEIGDLGRRLAVILFPLVLGGAAGATMLASLRSSEAVMASTGPAVPRRPRLARATIGVLAGAVGAAVVATTAFALPVLLTPAPPAVTAAQEPEPPPAPAEPAPPVAPKPTPTPTAPPQPPPAERVAVPSPANPAPDRTPPAAPTVATPLSGLLTNDPRPVFTGTGEPGARVDVTLGPVSFATTVEADGTWRAQSGVPVPDGIHTARISQADAAGNRSPSATLALTIDTVALAPTIEPLTAALVYLPMLAGTAEPGATVDILRDGTPLASVSTGADGGWTFDVPDPLLDGTTLVARQTDLAGNLSAESDPTVPLVFTRPSIVSPSPGHVVSTGAATSVVVELAGEDGASVEILIDGTPTGNIHQLGTVPISRVTPPLADGVHTIAVRYIEPGTGRVGSVRMMEITIAP